MRRFRSRLIIVSGSILLLLAIMIVVGLDQQMPPRITIINKSEGALRNVKIMGKGFSEVIQVLDQGEEKSLIVTLSGESGLEIQFDTPQGHISQKDLAYLEASGGYYAVLTVTQGYSISVKTGIDDKP